MTIKNNRPEQAAPFSADMTGAPQAGSLRLSQVQAGQALRRQAEEIAMENAALSSENLNALSSEENRQTLDELRIHQIELEMQNEEMKRTQLELVASRDQYFNFYDLSEQPKKISIFNYLPKKSDKKTIIYGVLLKESDKRISIAQIPALMLMM